MISKNMKTSQWGRVRPLGGLQKPVPPVNISGEILPNWANRFGSQTVHVTARTVFAFNALKSFSASLTPLCGIDYSNPSHCLSSNVPSPSLPINGLKTNNGDERKIGLFSYRFLIKPVSKRANPGKITMRTLEALYTTSKRNPERDSPALERRQ